MSGRNHRSKRRKPSPLPQNTVTDHGGATPPDNNPTQEHSKIDQLSTTPPDNHPNEEQSNIDPLPSIEAECQAAIAANKEGNPAEALRLMEETCRCYENCGFVHAARHKVHAKDASRVRASDPVLSQEHFQR